MGTVNPNMFSKYYNKSGLVYAQENDYEELPPHY